MWACVLVWLCSCESLRVFFFVRVCYLNFHVCSWLYFSGCVCTYISMRVCVWACIKIYAFVLTLPCMCLCFYFHACFYTYTRMFILVLDIASHTTWTQQSPHAYLIYKRTIHQSYKVTTIKLRVNSESINMHAPTPAMRSVPWSCNTTPICRDCRHSVPVYYPRGMRYLPKYCWIPNVTLTDIYQAVLSLDCVISGAIYD